MIKVTTEKKLPKGKIALRTYIECAPATTKSKTPPVSFMKQFQDVIHKEMLSTANIIRVAWDKKKPVGLMIGYHEPDHPLSHPTCTWLFVDAQYRRQGIAKELCKGLTVANINVEDIDAVGDIKQLPVLGVLGITDPHLFVTQDIKDTNTRFVTQAG